MAHAGHFVTQLADLFVITLHHHQFGGRLGLGLRRFRDNGRRRDFGTRVGDRVRRCHDALGRRQGRRHGDADRQRRHRHGGGRHVHLEVRFVVHRRVDDEARAVDRRVHGRHGGLGDKRLRLQQRWRRGRGLLDIERREDLLRQRRFVDGRADAGTGQGGGEATAARRRHDLVGGIQGATGGADGGAGQRGDGRGGRGHRLGRGDRGPAAGHGGDHGIGGAARARHRRWGHVLAGRFQRTLHGAFVIVGRRHDFDTFLDPAVGQDHCVRSVFLAHQVHGRAHIGGDEAFDFHAVVPGLWRRSRGRETLVVGGLHGQGVPLFPAAVKSNEVSVFCRGTVGCPAQLIVPTSFNRLSSGTSL